ncbi:MAG: hypothetical protein M3Z85_15100, partial [Acidobacteriota bacterium]|nr:hypothetical protein [Acidobacteriota bacterium]
LQEDNVYIAEIDPKSLEIISEPRQASENSRGRNILPAWAPDGQSIAFIRRGAVVPRLGLGLGGEADLVIRPVVSSKERILTRFRWQGAPGDLTWFPDSKSILLGEGSPILHMQVDVDTGKKRIIAKELSPGWNSNIAFSVDGSSLFYTPLLDSLRDPPVLRLMKRDLASGRDTELYRTESLAYGFFKLAVSPDGSQIAFLANGSRSNERFLITVPTNGGSAHELHRGSYNDPLPNSCAWTHDGAHVVIASWDSASRTSRFKAIPLAGGDARPLAISMPNLSDLTVSPDGRRVAFHGGTASSEELWMIRNLLPNDDREH